MFVLAYCFPLFVSAASHHPEDFLASIRGQPHEGQKIVQHFCSSCHAPKPLIQIGAPRMGVQQDWENRVKQGLQVLFEHTAAGYHAMPARGGCFECSDKQLKKAIKVLLSSDK